MSDPCLVEWCSRPVGDGYVCGTCSEKLRIALGDVNSLWEDLDAVLALQARYSTPEGRGGDKALPLNLEASEIGWVLRNTLNTWCKLVAEERGWDLPEDHPPKVAGWLLHQVEWIRHQRAGHQAIEEITSAVNAVRRAVDRPAERLYAGPCKDCNADLYGKAGSTAVKCKACGLDNPVSERLEWMWSQVTGSYVTAWKASVLLGRFGYPTAQKTIDKWFERKRITSESVDADGKRLYLWEDLTRLAKAHQPIAEEAS